MSRSVVAWGVSGAIGLGLWVLTLCRYNAAFEPTTVLPERQAAVIRVEDSAEIYSPAEPITSAPACAADSALPPVPAVHEGGCINVNTADEAALTTLPGVGPVLAQRIISYRRQYGPFTEPAQLCRVKGIGRARLEKINDRICF